MITAGLILLMIVMYTAQSLFCKLYSVKYPGEATDSSSVFSIVVGATIAMSGLTVCGFQFRPHGATLLLGLLNAAVIVGYNLCMVQASTGGPYSIQMVCVLSGGILVPALFSLTLGDRLSWMQWIAVLGILISLVLVNHRAQDQQVKRKSFFVHCVSLFFLNGLYGILLDVQQRLTGTEDKEEMIILTYAGAALASLGLMLCKHRRRCFSSFRQTKQSLVFLCVCAVASTLAIHLLVCIIPLVNITVLYTFDNAGVLLLSVIASCIFFGEKLSKINAVGCVLMLIGLTVISVF